MIARTATLAASILRRRGALAAAAALLLAGLLGGRLPLVGLPGYELGLASTWLALPLSVPAALAAVRAERRRGDGGSPAVAALAATLAVAALLGALLAGAAIAAALGPCRTLAAAELVPVLSLPTALLAAAIVTAGGWRSGGRAAPAALALALATLGSLAATLATAWRGPAAFALDPLLGVWPGPLYDEAIGLDARLLLFRLETAALGAALVAAAEGVARRRRGRAGRGAALAAALAAAGAIGARRALRSERLDGDRAGVVAALGSLHRGRTCTLVTPRELPPAAAAALAAQCEFDAADVAAALGLPAPPPVTVFVHRSADERRRLVGAAATSFTKPWLGEIQLLAGPDPHPVLRHELVHAVAAALHPGPLGVPARAGVLVSAGLVEGLAVALEPPRDGFTVHEWTAAARRLGALPDVAGLLGPAGFWAAAPARAYTAAGSFLAFLLERRGAARVARLYRTGDFEAAFGEPLPALLAAWGRFLDRVPVPPRLAAVAAARFARPALLARPCAREVASLEEAAGRDAAEDRPARACAALRRVARLTGESEPLLAAARLLAERGDLDGAARALAEARAAPGAGDPVAAGEIAAATGDLAARRGDLRGAAAGWRAALALAPGIAGERRLCAELAAVADPETADAILPWLLDGPGRPGALERLERSPAPLAAYLLGRWRAAGGDAAAARAPLARAAAAALPEPLGAEARFLAAEASCEGGAPAEGAARLRALPAGALGAAGRARRATDLRRCAFEAARGGGD